MHLSLKMYLYFNGTYFCNKSPSNQTLLACLVYVIECYFQRYDSYGISLGLHKAFYPSDLLHPQPAPIVCEVFSHSTKTSCLYPGSIIQPSVQTHTLVEGKLCILVKLFNNKFSNNETIDTSKY